jgi:hypothetical protein
VLKLLCVCADLLYVPGPNYHNGCASMRLRDPLSRSVSWITRIIGYSFGAVAIAIAWYAAGSMSVASYYTDCMATSNEWGPPSQTAMQRAKALVGCVDARAGTAEALAFYPTKKLFAELPSAPCSYVGIWRSAREGSIYSITLSADGQFVADPVTSSAPDARRVTGSWGVVGKEDKEFMVWLYDEGQIWPPDVNPMKNRTSAGFTLIERNGSRTDFSRTGELTCVQPRARKMRRARDGRPLERELRTARSL